MTFVISYFERLMLFRSLRHAVLPIMLSSKLLPEMESEEAALKEQILAGVSNLPLQLQTEKLQVLFVSQFLLYYSYLLCVCVCVRCSTYKEFL